MNKIELAGLAAIVLAWIWSKFGDKIKNLLPAKLNPFASKSASGDPLLDATAKWKSLYDQLKDNTEGKATLKTLWPQLMSEITKEETNDVK